MRPVRHLGNFGTGLVTSSAQHEVDNDDGDDKGAARAGMNQKSAYRPGASGHRQGVSKRQGADNLSLFQAETRFAAP